MLKTQICVTRPQRVNVALYESRHTECGHSGGFLVFNSRFTAQDEELPALNFKNVWLTHCVSKSGTGDCADCNSVFFIVLLLTKTKLPFQMFSSHLSKKAKLSWQTLRSHMGEARGGAVG